MKSKTLIERQVKKKSNQDIVKTILAAKKNAGWFKIAEILSSPRRKRIVMNLDKINTEAEEGETIVIPGKILSQGEINKEIKIIGLSFSESAKDKLLKSKTEFSSILDEIKQNPEAKEIRILY